MAEALARREFAFYFQNGSPIPPIHENCISFLREQKLSDEEIIAHGYKPNQLYVMYYRYNNPGRKEIYKLFGRKITGQVLDRVACRDILVTYEKSLYFYFPLLLMPELIHQL